jgi:hypothetical protein
MLCTLFGIWCVAAATGDVPNGATLLMGLRPMTHTANRRTAVFEFADGRRINYRPETTHFFLCNQAADTEQDDGCGDAEQ